MRKRIYQTATKRSIPIVTAFTTTIMRQDYSLLPKQARMLLRMSIFICLLLGGVTAIQAQWQYAGNPRFSRGISNYNSLAFGPDGTAYMGYSDSSHGSRVVIASYDSLFDSWNESIPNFYDTAFGTAKYVSIATGSYNHIVYVAYKDGAHGDRVTVKQYNDSTRLFSPVGKPGFSAGTADYTSLAIASDNTLYVAFKDGSNGNRATVMKYNDASQSWSIVGRAGFSVGNADYISLAIDYNILYVAFKDGSNRNKATVMKFDRLDQANSNAVNGNIYWTKAGTTDVSAGEANYVDLAIEPYTRQPYIVYVDKTTNNRVTVKKLNNNTWFLVGDSTFADTATTYTSIDFSRSFDGSRYNQYIGYNNAGSTVVRVLDYFSPLYGNYWRLLSNINTFSERVSYTSLAVSPKTGNPSIGFQDTYPDSTTLKYDGRASMLTYYPDGQQNVTVSITSSANRSCQGSPVTFTATVLTKNTKAPVTSGRVSFVKDTTVLADNIPLDANGKASFTLDSSGLTGGSYSYTITATYKGTSGYLSGKNSFYQTVARRPTVKISGGGTYCGNTNIVSKLFINGSSSGTVKGTLSDGTAFSGTTPSLQVTVSPDTTTTYTIATLSDEICVAQPSDLPGSATVTINKPYKYFTDADRDGYGSGVSALFCTVTAPAGYSIDSTDCNDNDSSVHKQQTYYADADGDGYGAGAVVLLCASSAPAGYSINNTDCNDKDNSVHSPQT